MDRSHWVLPLAFGLAILILTGCGKDEPSVKVAPASGRVVSVGDIKARGLILFVPNIGVGKEAIQAEGIVAEDGAFSMETYPHGKGVIPGSYKVILVGSVAKGAKRYGRYSAPRTTPWTIEIDEAGNTDIELKLTDD
jgi:hypothetical protein